MNKTSIAYSDYIEEQNMPNEHLICKREGPIIPTGARGDDGKAVRIPHSGFVYDNVEYTLVGFGRLDKPIYSIPSDIEKEARKMLGNAAMFQFTADRKMSLSTALKKTPWKEIKEEISRLRATGNYGPVQAFDAALQPAEEQPDDDDFGAY